MKTKTITRKILLIVLMIINTIFINKANAQDLHFNGVSFPDATQEISSTKLLTLDNNNLANKWISPNDLKATNIQAVANYDAIPLEEGVYLMPAILTLYQSGSTMPTNIINNSDGSPVLLKDVMSSITAVDGTGSSSDLLVYRTKTTLVSGFFSPVYTNSYRDSFYTSLGELIGTAKADDPSPLFKINPSRARDALKDNTYIIENSKGFFEVYLSFNVDNNLRDGNYIEIPIAFRSPIFNFNNKVYQIFDSYVTTGDEGSKKIQNYELGFNSANNLMFKDLDGNFTRDKENTHGYIYMSFKRNDERESMDISSKVKTGFTGINSINIDSSVGHSAAMTLIYNEASSTTGIVYDRTNDVTNSFIDNDKIIDNDIGLAFSAASGMSLLKNNSLSATTFTVVSLGSNDLIETTDYSAGEFLRHGVLVTSRAETDNDGTDPLGTSYGNGVEFNEPTLSADLTSQGYTDWSGSAEHQQSPATGIVAGKFKKIKESTGAPWHIIRQACRETASNSGSYNIYRGFGKIDVTAAINWITTNYDNVISSELADFHESVTPFTSKLNYDDKKGNTAVTKNDMSNLTGWADYQDTQYTLANPYNLSVRDGVVTLPNNSGNIVDFQKPSDVVDFYDNSTQTIIGKNGNGINITIEFKIKPTSKASNVRITTSIDIGGSVGEIYFRDFNLTKGNGIEHYYLSSFNAYNLSTWESNGGAVKIRAYNSSVDIYDIRYVITRTHKSR